jgi:uncharacterized hydrophobic protein (TIGR00271 family)
MQRFKLKIFRLFNLRRDQDDPEIIDATIREGVSVTGANLWGLIGAIFIASIGLNVNSTAVIIGAMLISPLMGPIVGIGYGIGIKDLALIRLSLRNLGIFILISLLTATTYFLITPLNIAQSELLARTSPNLWDVLIAFVGGSLGMIGATRRQGSNIVPGVAIATALMPPLCTAGFGLATGNWTYFGGAFYLFTINSVFIAFACLLIVKMLRLPARGDGQKARWQARIIITATVLATAVPSGFLAVRFVSQKLFEQTAQTVLASIESDPRYVLLGREISTIPHRVVLTMGGENGNSQVAEEVKRQFQSKGYGDTEVVVRNIGSEKVDVGQITEALKKELLQNTLQQLQDSMALNRKLETEAQTLLAANSQRKQLIQEVLALYPGVACVTVGNGEHWQLNQPTPQATQIVNLTTKQALTNVEKKRLSAWLKTRFPDQSVRVQVTPILARKGQLKSNSSAIDEACGN